MIEQPGGADREPAKIARGGGGVPLVSKETVVLITLAKRDSEKPANVIIRGVGQAGVCCVAARRSSRSDVCAGPNEIIVGSSIAARFRGMGLGDPVRFGGATGGWWAAFDAGKSGFDSRSGATPTIGYCCRPSAAMRSFVEVFQLADASAFADARRTLGTTRGQTPLAGAEPLRRPVGDAGRTSSTSWGSPLSVIFSIGGGVGAAITMYAAVASRTGRDRRTLALGFANRACCSPSWSKACLLSLLGGARGAWRRRR